MSDSSRPGTGAIAGTSASASTSTSPFTGIRGIRATASECWDDDFLWQHSSSSDLHLPSSTIDRQRHGHRSSNRNKRSSTASSSSTSASERHHHQHHQHGNGLPPLRVQTRPYRKSSSLSNTSTMADVSVSPTEAPADSHTFRSHLSRSASSSHSQSNAPARSHSHSHSYSYPHSSRQSSNHWTNVSQTSLAEEEDEPTITLSNLVSRQQPSTSAFSPSHTFQAIPMSRTSVSHSSTSPQSRSPTIPPMYGSSMGSTSRKDKLVPPSPSFFRTASSSSWRSTTPSLASDTWSAAHTASATETDNETAEEEEEDDTSNELHDTSLSSNVGDPGDETWEQLNLSPEGMMLAGMTRRQGSSSRRKRGRRNTLNGVSRNTPRTALSALFGNVVGNNGNRETADIDTLQTASKRLGLFRRSSKMKGPESKMKVDNLMQGAVIHMTRQETGQTRAHTQIHSPEQHTPPLEPRNLPQPAALSQQEDRTVRARQSTGASSSTSKSPFFPTSPSYGSSGVSQVSPGSSNPITNQPRFEETPRGSNTNTSFSNGSLGRSYNSILSDRLRFDNDNNTETASLPDSGLSTHPPALKRDIDDADAEVDERQAASATAAHHASLFLSPPLRHHHTAQSADRSTTSLISNQSSATFTSTYTNDSQSLGISRKVSVPRRKLKKTRPQTPASPLLASPTSPNQIYDYAVGEVDPTSFSGNQTSSQTDRTLSPSFVFPPPARTSTSQTPSRQARSPAVSLASGDTGNTSTSETASARTATSLSKQIKTKLASGSIAPSLRRRVSRKKKKGVAEESSADESGFVNTRRGSLDKTSVTRVVPVLEKTSSRQLRSTARGEAERQKQEDAEMLASTSRMTSGAWPKEDFMKANQQQESQLLLNSGLSCPGVPPTGSMRGTRLLAGLSKRMSIDFKGNKSTNPTPERKKSVIFARTEISETTSVTCPEQGKDIDARQFSSEAVPRLSTADPALGIVKKHKRPLSLSGFLSRSTGPFDAPRSRSSTASSTQASLGITTDAISSGRPMPLAPMSASVTGGFRKRPSGFLHRSTASSGNIPTAKALLGGTALQTASLGLFDNRRPSLDGVQPRSPPVLQHRRSFNPLWRSATATVPEERPQSSLSFLSETSTVRPLSTLPTAASTATITALKHERKASVETSSRTESPSTTRLRQRHLPSLSLTLLPSATSTTPPRSPGPSFPALSPRMMQRAHSENPYDTSHSPIRSHYFTTTSRATSSTHSGTSPSSKGTSIAETPPAQKSRRLEELDGSGMLVRRVSLSDLKIPQRISNAQAKIGQDLKRVKEFKEGVEELKRLRKVYRGLVSSAAPSALSTSINSKTGSHEVNEASPASTPVLPEETTARFDNLMARVAVDYKRWWEIADVLINLADGADPEEGINEDEQQRDESTGRERCKSEQTSSNFPPEISRDLNNQKHNAIPGFQASKIALQADEDPSDHCQAEMSISVHKSQSQAVSTAVQRKVPQLTRSFSASSLSPASAHVSQTLHVTTNLPTSTTITEDHPNNVEDQSNTLSERQLDILRGMLNPSVGLPSTPSNTSMTSRSADNSPARTPSITSISPRSQSFMHRLVPLTPFLSSTSSTSLSVSSVQRPHISAGTNITPSSSSTSSSIINLNRRNSTKKSGHIVIANLPPHSSRMEEVKAEEERGSSPIPDSPPFHVSNMLPTPEHTMTYSPSSPSHIQQQRPAVSRSTSLSTSTKTFAASSSSSGISSPPQTPLLRRGRLRAASRAGIFGLRDFLKGFNSSGHGSSARKSTLEGRATVECVEDDAEADITYKRMPERIEQTSISDSTLIKNQGHLNLSKQAICDSPARISRSNPENNQNAANIGSPSSNSSLSEEEEDWDRHSSDEDMSKEAEGSLPRSDTQATIVPLSSKNQAILSHLKGGRELDNEPHQSQDEQNLQSTSDQYPNHSTSTLGTVVQYATVSVGQGDQGSVYPMNQGEPRSAPIVAGASLESQDKNKVRLSISASASSNTRSDMKAKELVMTSEAMPVLLAKIMEVKEHCSTCVTELRNVTV